jgi:subtilisin family serine protease
MCHDGWGFGQWVAGVIAAERDNGIGIAGIAPEVELAIFKFMNDTGWATTLDEVAGIDWAIANGADIITLPYSTPYCRDIAIERRAIQRARAAGALVVGQAGGRTNCASEGVAGVGDAPNYPGAYPEVLSVGGTNGAGQVWVASYLPRETGVAAGTACNESVDIMAPAEAIHTTDVMTFGETVYTAGTDVAAAHVTAVAALVMSQDRLSPDKVRKRLLGTTTSVAPHPERAATDCAGLGQVNLAAALAAGSEHKSR